MGLLTFTLFHNDGPRSLQNFISELIWLLSQDFVTLSHCASLKSYTVEIC